MKRYVGLRIVRPNESVAEIVGPHWSKWQLQGQRKTDYNWETIGCFESKEQSISFGKLYRKDNNITIFDEHGYGIN